MYLCTKEVRNFTTTGKQRIAFQGEKKKKNEKKKATEILYYKSSFTMVNYRARKETNWNPLLKKFFYNSEMTELQ